MKYVVKFVIIGFRVLILALSFSVVLNSGDGTFSGIDLSNIDANVRLFILALMFFYFTPTQEAYDRNHDHAEAILVMNLLLGWTVLGWIAALIWAHTQRNP
jgi:hypothetical protein